MMINLIKKIMIKHNENSIINLINNKIKDEYGREITGVAIGKCKCGENFVRLIVIDKDNNLPCYTSWCGECNLFEKNHIEEEIPQHYAEPNNW